jgi:hypothetical protein
MILPQDKQLGAVANSGWTDALQGHFRRSVESEGFVDSSSEAIAEVKSRMLEVVAVVDLDGVEAPECAVFLTCFVLTLGRSDIRLPDAEGGSLYRGGEGSLEGEGETFRAVGIVHGMLVIAPRYVAITFWLANRPSTM